MFMMPQVIIHAVPFKGKNDMTSPYRDQFWVAEGICELLKIKNPKKAIEKVKPEDTWEITYKEKHDSEETITQLLVNFSGLCTLMLYSESPVAEKFKYWVAQTVVPSVLEEESESLPLDEDLKVDMCGLGLLPS